MDENNGYGQEVTERESSSAEMVAIHQAMMEELGINRKNALPLEDKDGNVPTAPLVVPIKRLRPENPVSIWHNLNLDDTEPGVEDLDDIASGQLYRLRRGGSGLSSSSRGGHSASRGRGGTSNRGGHVSAGGRGNFAGAGKDVDSSRFGERHFNDTRRGGKSHARVDAGIARLQREAEFSRMSRTGDRSIKVPLLAPRSAKSALRAAAPAVAPRATLSGVNRPITSRFKLAPPAAFLSHNKIGCSPHGRVAEPVSSITTPSTSNGLSAPAPSRLTPHGGLVASRWASPAPKLVNTSEQDNLEQFAAPETPNSTFAPGDFADSIVPAVGSNTSKPNHHLELGTSALPANSSESNYYVQSTVTIPLTIVTNGLSTHHSVTRTVIDEKLVKVSNDKSKARQATARLIKFDKKSPLTLEVQAGNDIILREVLTEAATLKAEINIVTYQADSTTERKPTWKLQFQLPGPALGFVNYHTFKLSELRRNGCASRFLGQGNQNSSIAISPVPSSAVSTSSNATSRNDLAYSANRISSATFADLSQLNGEAMLFSLGEEESQAEDNQPPTYSSFQDLLSLMEVDVVEGTLQVLNAKHGGSFFDHVSQLAKGIGLENDADFMKHAKNAFIGGLSSSRYSRSKPILSITEELVSNFLSKSDTLQKFPREFIDTYVKEISKKILAKAQNPQNPSQPEYFNYSKSLNTETGHLIDVTEVPKPVKSVSATKTVAAIKPAVVIKSIGTSNLVSRQERRTYSIKEMIQMRPGAKLSREIIAARDSLAKYLPGYKREIAPADIIQTTASGLRIVAGKNQGPRYRESHRATATKVQPSERKTRFANPAINQEVPQAFQQNKVIKEQTLEQSSFVQAKSPIGSTKHASSDSIDRQDYCNLASSKAAEVNREGIKNGTLASISVEHKTNRLSAHSHRQSLSGGSNGVSSIAIQAQNSNVSKKSPAEAESKATVKVESENKTSPLLLPKKRGLSTSKYATTEVVNHATVLHAASSYEPLPHQTVKRQDLPSKPSVSPKSLRSTQLHDAVLWETLLASKQIQPSIKAECPETPKKEPVSRVEIASKFEQVHEFKAIKEKEALVSVIENAGWTTIEKATKQIAKVIGSQNNNPDVTLEKTTAMEMIIPKLDSQLPTGSRHVATGSEVKILAQVLSNLEVKTEKDNNVVTGVLPALERSTSPTIEEILEKKRVNGLATSKWAGPQTTVFKPARHTPVLTSVDKNQSGFNKPQDNSAFYSQNSQYNPAIQAQAPYEDFSQHGNQYSTLQEQTSIGVFSPEVDQPYPVQHMQSEQSLAPVLSTILVTNPVTGEVSEVTGILQQTRGPVATQMPSAYLEQSPGSVTGFTAFPPRPTMFGKSFSNSDSEDVLKATAPVFTPCHQRNVSSTARSALSPVYHRQNAQQEAIQARLNKSLAEQRM